MSVWSEFFPKDRPRSAQVVALDFIFDSLKDADDIFVEAPTGIGKSPIAETVGLYLEAHSQKTYITTTTVDLETQYIDEYGDFGLRQLHSSRHYACPGWGNCSIGGCTIVQQSEDVSSGDHDDLIEFLKDETLTTGAADRSRTVMRARCSKANCPYEVAKTEFDDAAVSIANSAYLITKARFVSSFPTRDLLIVDEAHQFADQVTSSYAFVITQHEIRPMIESDFPAEGDEIRWLRDCYAPFLSWQIRQAHERFSTLSRHDPDLEKAMNKVRALVLKRSNLETVLFTSARDWIFDAVPGDRFAILPVWANHFAPNILRRLGSKRIFLSATLPDFRRQAKWLGIKAGSPRSRFLSLPSPFPEEHRLIYCHPVVEWDWKNPEPAYDAAAHELTRILAMHPTQRGLVHVSSYRQAEEIVARVGSPRLLTHTDSESRGQAIKQMFATAGAVLVSPSAREGLDFFGDRSEFQVIAKLPYASLGDKRVKRRLETDSWWYGLDTAQKIVQAAGRSVRSMTDSAATYILDKDWPRFVRRNSHFFPLYFLKATREMPEAIDPSLIRS